jgi:hypothetical protein
VVHRYGAANAVAWIFGWGALVTDPFGLYEMRGINFTDLPPYVWAVVGAIVLVTSAAYHINAWASVRVNPTTVAAYIYLQPLLAFAFAPLILGERRTRHRQETRNTTGNMIYTCNPVETRCIASLLTARPISASRAFSAPRRRFSSACKSPVRNGRQAFAEDRRLQKVASRQTCGPRDAIGPLSSTFTRRARFVPTRFSRPGAGWAAKEITPQPSRITRKSCN